MRALLAILLLALLLLQSATPFTAQWDSATSATLHWSESGRACVYREPAIGAPIYLGCFDGPQILQLGHAQTDAAYRPTAGDRYVLDFGDHIARAALVARPVYLGVVRR